MRWDRENRKKKGKNNTRKLNSLSAIVAMKNQKYQIQGERWQKVKE